jgi:hypothetical protein
MSRKRKRKRKQNREMWFPSRHIHILDLPIFLKFSATIYTNVKKPERMRLRPELRDSEATKSPLVTASLSLVIMLSDTPPNTPIENTTDTFLESPNDLKRW